MFSSLLSECSNSTITTTDSSITSSYMTASMIMCLALVTPHSSTQLCVVTRSLLSLSHLVYCVWSYSQLCSVSLFCWHSVLFMVSIAKFSEVMQTLKYILRFTS